MARAQSCFLGEPKVRAITLNGSAVYVEGTGFTIAGTKSVVIGSPSYLWLPPRKGMPAVRDNVFGVVVGDEGELLRYPFLQGLRGLRTQGRSRFLPKTLR